MSDAPKPNETQEKTPSFEMALDQLQQTVKRLESGELSLEQALQSFESGVKLTRLCQEHLSTVEQRVEVLMKAEPKVETQPFNR